MKFDWTRLVAWWPTNKKSPKVQAAVILVVLLVVLAGATRCHAHESYVQAGAGSTVVRGQTEIADLAIVFPHRGPGDSSYEIGTTFIGESSLKGAAQRNNFAWRAALVDGFGRFDVGLGAAFLQNTDTYNGSHLNYVLMLGYRFERLPITLRLQHFSNGGTQSPNKGRDMLFLAWRFE